MSILPIYSDNSQGSDLTLRSGKKLLVKSLTVTNDSSYIDKAVKRDSKAGQAKAAP
jgi:hypothetical protein